MSKQQEERIERVELKKYIAIKRHKAIRREVRKAWTYYS